MKKQLTIFAAAAMVATLASVAAAATTPTVTMGGKMEYKVEYSALDHKFGGDDGVAEGALTGDQKLEFSVATTGNPNFGTVTFTAGNIKDGNWGTTAITGTVGATTIKLGTVDGNYQQDLATSSGGPGAAVTQAFGPISVNAFTATAGAADSKGFKDVTGGKVAVTSGSNSAYAAVLVTPNMEGAFQVSGNYAQGTLLTANGTYTSTLVGDTKKDSLAYLQANVNSTPMPGLSVYGSLYNVDKGFKTMWGKTDGDNIGVGEWAGRDAKYDGANIKVGAGYDVLKIKDAVALNVGGEYFGYADKENYIKGTVKYTPVFLDNAFVQLNDGADKSADNTEVGATFIYNISGVKLTATGKFKNISKFQAVEAHSDNFGELRVDKTLGGWLNTWARLRKPYKADDAAHPSNPVNPSFGVNATLSF